MLNPEREMRELCNTLKKLFQRLLNLIMVLPSKPRVQCFALSVLRFGSGFRVFALIMEYLLFSTRPFQINSVIGLDHFIILEHERGGKQEVGR